MFVEPGKWYVTNRLKVRHTLEVIWVYWKFGKDQAVGAFSCQRRALQEAAHVPNCVRRLIGQQQWPTYRRRWMRAGQRFVQVTLCSTALVIPGSIGLFLAQLGVHVAARSSKQQAAACGSDADRSNRRRGAAGQ